MSASHFLVVHLDIDQSGTASDPCFVGDKQAGSLQFPAAFTGASITYQVSNDKAVWSGLKDKAGSAISATVVAASVCVPIPVEVFSHAWFRVVDHTAETTARDIVACVKY